MPAEKPSKSRFDEFITQDKIDQAMLGHMVKIAIDVNSVEPGTISVLSKDSISYE